MPRGPLPPNPGARPGETEALHDRLRRALARHLNGGALICFSGGVDSTLLLKVALEVLGPRAVALLAESPSLAAREKEDARRLAQELGAELVVVASEELDRPGYRENPTNRCYFCKAELLALARPVAAARGLGTVCLGTNLDDLGDHRPGLIAADEEGAVHPLVEAQLDKAAVRALSKALGLRTWDKPALACLSSRFPYGTEITAERLERVDRFETGLRDLGFVEVRVRFHEPVARLELAEAELGRALEPAVRAAILALGRATGFAYVALDLAGFRSGSLNTGLVPPAAVARKLP